jgi:hypothetical protein
MKRYFKLIKKYPESQPLGTIFEKDYYSENYNLPHTYLVFVKKEEVENNTEFFKEIFIYY